MKTRALLSAVVVRLGSVGRPIESGPEIHVSCRDAGIVNGYPKKPAEINADGRNVRARNENGDPTRLEVERDGDVRALDWRGLRGDVKRNRIDWANGTMWTKSPSDRK